MDFFYFGQTRLFRLLRTRDRPLQQGPQRIHGLLGCIGFHEVIYRGGG